MTRAELNGYRRRLLTLRGRIGETVHDLRDDGLDGETNTGRPEVSNEWGDLSVREYEKQVDLAMAGTEEQILGEIEAALTRIEAGKFGRCTSCQQPISNERLRVLPYVRLCFACARSNESSQS